MRVAVIGAGIAGLGAARWLSDAGVDVRVFEKSRGVGGRIASRRVEGTVVDHGTPDLQIHGALAALAAERLTPGEAVALTRPSARWDGERIVVDGNRGSVAYAPGLTRLAKAMAEGVDVRLGTRVAALRAVSGGLELGDEQGNTHGVADRVLVTAPAPQAADLLERSPEGGGRVRALRDVVYDPAVVVILGLRRPAPPDWWFVRCERGAIESIAFETAKGRPPVDGVVPVVVRLGTATSAQLLDASDEVVLAVALSEITDVLGGAPFSPAWSQVKRWRFSRPASCGDRSHVNPVGVSILVAGDSLAPQGVQAAYDDGVAAAEQILMEA